ncbi:PH domain-containing protein [Planomonospora sp. ID67723]|uniref:PH domain-containing protein n=1 Tax=Planomonospora sp. ID67723 TaxID=2738134 RepID=UPI0018C409E8|nr:PH domain-containing protein [Planomonospora sp. ID67723]MBG0832035.1 PH domain-containing protein [Planomonospora sp. ID67723]
MRTVAGAHPRRRRTAAVMLRPPRNQVDARAVKAWTAELLLLAVPVAAAAVAAYWIFTSHPVWLTVLTGGFAALVLGFAVVAPHAYYRLERWEVTGEAVYTRKGWFTHVWRVAPMSRIQTVDTERGPVKRLFGLADVTVTTASAAGAIKIEALDHEVAVALAERLTALTQAAPGDAT